MKVRFCFSAEQLKNIALVSMVIDMLPLGLLNSQNWLRALPGVSVGQPCALWGVWLFLSLRL